SQTPSIGPVQNPSSASLRSASRTSARLSAAGAAKAGTATASNANDSTERQTLHIPHLFLHSPSQADGERVSAESLVQAGGDEAKPVGGRVVDEQWLAPEPAQEHESDEREQRHHVEVEADVLEREIGEDPGADEHGVEGDQRRVAAAHRFAAREERLQQHQRGVDQHEAGEEDPVRELVVVEDDDAAQRAGIAATEARVQVVGDLVVAVAGTE